MQIYSKLLFGIILNNKKRIMEKSLKIPITTEMILAISSEFGCFVLDVRILKNGSINFAGDLT